MVMHTYLTIYTTLGCHYHTAVSNARTYLLPAATVLVLEYAKVCHHCRHQLLMTSELPGCFSVFI